MGRERSRSRFGAGDSVGHGDADASTHRGWLIGLCGQRDGNEPEQRGGDQRGSHCELPSRDRSNVACEGARCFTSGYVAVTYSSAGEAQEERRRAQGKRYSCAIPAPFLHLCGGHCVPAPSVCSIARHEQRSSRTALAQLGEPGSPRHSLLDPCRGADRGIVRTPLDYLSEPMTPAVDPARLRRLQGVGMICGLTAGAWLGAAEAPTKLVTLGLSPLVVSLAMVDRSLPRALELARADSREPRTSAPILRQAPHLDGLGECSPDVCGRWRTR